MGVLPFKTVEILGQESQSNIECALGRKTEQKKWIEYYYSNSSDTSVLLYFIQCRSRRIFHTNMFGDLGGSLGAH